MRYLIYSFFLVLIIIAIGCGNSTNPEEDEYYFPNYNTNYVYNYGETDANYNFIGDIFTNYWVFKGKEYLFDNQFNIVNILNTDNNFTEKISFSFKKDKFTIISRYFQPLFDTTFSQNLNGYFALNNIFIDPFIAFEKNEIIRDTSIIDFFFLINLIQNKPTIIAPTKIIQEVSSNILADTNVEYNNKVQLCKNVNIFANRIIRLKNNTTDKFIRPSSDSTYLNEFYFDNDNAIYADKIEMKFIYLKKVGFVKILIKQRTIYGIKYSKWELQNIVQE